MHSSSQRQKQSRQPVKQAAAVDQPESSTDFGILQHNHTDKPFSESTASRGRELGEHERGIGAGLKPHPKRMPTQAAPDHGDHQ
jgi:hypothetical protein